MNLLATRARRKFLFGALYLSEGAPIGFLWWALPTRLRTGGVDVADITALTAFLAIPWSLKFLWAPLVDVYRGPRVGYRGWIVAAQLVMGAALLPLLWLDPVTEFGTIYGCLVVHAFAAATQDVAIDALAVSSTTESERGSLNGVMQATMLTGRFTFGAGVLRFGAEAGMATIAGFLVATVWATTALVLLAREPVRTEREEPSHRERLRRFVSILRAAASLKATRWALVFAILGGAAFEAAGAVAGPLLVDLGHPEAAVGTFYLVAAPLMLLGSLTGGPLSDRLGRRRTVGGFTVLVAAVVLALAVVTEASPSAVPVVLGVLFFAIGLFTAASYALFMDLTDPRLGATQFSAYMGGTNLCEAWAAFGVGRLHAAVGYPIAFASMAAVSLIALIPLRRLRPNGRAESVLDGSREEPQDR